MDEIRHHFEVCCWFLKGNQFFFPIHSRCPFDRVWIEIDGLRWFRLVCPIYQGHLFPKGNLVVGFLVASLENQQKGMTCPKRIDLLGLWVSLLVFCFWILVKVSQGEPFTSKFGQVRGSFPKEHAHMGVSNLGEPPKMVVFLVGFL